MRIFAEWQRVLVFSAWSSPRRRSFEISAEPERVPDAAKTQTHRGNRSPFPWKFPLREFAGVQYLSVFYIARGCPFHTRTGESSQNSEYTVT